MTATDRLNTMQQRCDAATEGPWRESWPGQCCENNYCVEGPRGRPGIHQTDTDLSKRDAEFIAAARTDLPATIAALRDVLDLCNQAVEQARDWPPNFIGRPCVSVSDIRNAIEGALTAERPDVLVLDGTHRKEALT